MTSRNSLLFLLVLLFVATALSAHAYPTLYGDSGLVIIPTADVMPFTQFDIASDYTRFSSQGQSTTALPLRVDYGIARGAEIFASYAPTSEKGFEEFGAGTKVFLVNENFDKHIPAISVGARFNHIKDVSTFDVLNGYVVASATLFRYRNFEPDSYRIRGHLGLEYLRYNLNGATTFANAFVGVSYEGSSGVTVALEYLPRLRDNGVIFRESSVSGLIRFPLSEDFTLEFGSTRPYNRGDNSIFAGVNYHYGKESETPDRAPTILY